MEVKNLPTTILEGKDIQAILSNVGIDNIMDTLIEKLRKGIQQFDSQKTEIPIRSGFNYTQPYTGLVEWMPIHLQEDKVVIKLVGYHPNNPEFQDLPTILSTVSAYDTTNGHLLGLMDGVLLTALRTGAASAVASEIMAKPDSEILGLIGAGAQAVTQLHGLSRVFDLKEVHFFDIDPYAMASFKDRCRILNLDVNFVPSSIQEIVEHAEIISTSTSIEIGEGPLFFNLETRPDLHINAVGSDFPGKVEIPMDFLNSGIVCPDFLDQAMKEGECQQMEREQVGPELVELVKNPEKYDHIKHQKSVFDSTGWALEDQIAMDMFLELAKKLGIGKEVEIEYVPLDVKNPYDFLSDEENLPEPSMGEQALGQ